ncbi:DUF6461 domain-containing protein [Nonomuraea fuscirosea]|uniref:DUF6461 domain-containing protein n=1 Tax=Nonomuraea fuscirosea TaxID=1291556 RepID=UPI0033DDE9A0
MAERDGLHDLTLEGTLIHIDRVKAGRSYFSGRHRLPGMNVQVLASPAGRGQGSWLLEPSPPGGAGRDGYGELGREEDRSFSIDRTHRVGGYCEYDAMIATPEDTTRFRDVSSVMGHGYCFTYVHGLTSEEVVTRLGGGLEEFTPMTLEELSGVAYSRHDGKNMLFGVVVVGDWALLVEPLGSLGVTEEIIVPLSAGTRLVSQYYRDIMYMDYFYWIEDGKIRFGYMNQDGYSHWINDGEIQLKFPYPERYSEEMPDELAGTMERIDSVYPEFPYPHEGPAFLLAECLTGITLTPQLLEESIYLCGGLNPG